MVKTMDRENWDKIGRRERNNVTRCFEDQKLKRCSIWYCETIKRLKAMRASEKISENSGTIYEEIETHGQTSEEDLGPAKRGILVLNRKA